MAKKMPKKIEAVVNTAKKYADNEDIGYCQWPNKQDVMCTGFVAKVFDDRSVEIPLYSEIHSAQAYNGNGWKSYPFSADNVWPGDILITSGKHAGIALGWGGPVAEAVTSGLEPTNYTTFTDEKSGESYDLVVALKNAGNYGFNLGKSKYYQTETKRVCYYYDEGYNYYQLTSYPWSTISPRTYARLSPEEQAKYIHQYKKDDIRYGTLEVYKMHGSGFWPEPGDQGGEVIANGSVNDNNRDTINRYIKAWLGIDHFKTESGGIVYKIPQ